VTGTLAGTLTGTLTGTVAPGAAPEATPGAVRARTVLVTGGSRGIGRAIAERLAGSGHRVAVVWAADREGARSCVDGIAAAGGSALEVRADVSDRTGIEAAYGTVEDRWGPVEVLVNNAGMLRDRLLVSMSDEDWDRVLAVNLGGAFHCTRRALRPMIRARWGRIVNVASVAGVCGSAGQANYSAAKAGMIGLTRSAAREVATRGITVNAVVPGPVDTGIIGHLPAARREELRAAVPAGRFGTPAEVAGAVAFLCGEDAAYVTGAILPVDGGMSMGH
jgi:3-oxoacyl-[acyl-carrier protein] reductase